MFLRHRESKKHKTSQSRVFRDFSVPCSERLVLTFAAFFNEYPDPGGVRCQVKDKNRQRQVKDIDRQRQVEDIDRHQTILP